MSDSEFGPWIDHDGKGCPCAGQVVIVMFRSGEVDGPYVAMTRRVGIGDNPRNRWVHDKPRPTDVIRYRIKKPRGLTLLEEILKEVDDTHPLKVKEFDPCRSQRSPSQFGV